MESTYYYKFSYRATGIAIILAARTTGLGDCSNPRTEVFPGIFLSVQTNNLLPSEVGYLEIGIKLMYGQLQPIIERDGPIVVEITKVEFALTDYQEEGLACAMAGWLANHFRLTAPVVPIIFNEETRLYEFTFPPVPDVQS